MTRLSDAQLVILSAAAQREDRNVLPLPGSLRGGAAMKVVTALLSRRLIAETVTDYPTADASLNRVWRNARMVAVLLHITDAGLAAIGVDADEGPAAHAAAAEGPEPAEPGNEAPDGEAPSTARALRPCTKQAKLVEMLRQPDGATIEEIVAATNWQPHTVRGAVAGALKKRLGLEVTSENADGRGRVYQLSSE